MLHWSLLAFSFAVTCLAIGSAWVSGSSRHANIAVWLARAYLLAVLLSWALYIVPVFAAVANADGPSKATVLAQGIAGTSLHQVGFSTWLALLFVSGMVRGRIRDRARSRSERPPG